jgi:hypothetical protein
MRSIRFSVLGVGAVVGLICGAALTTIAMAQEDGDVFYACEKNGSLASGSVSVNTEPDCKGGSALVSWNQAGPQGLPGDAGADGVNGLDGTDATVETYTVFGPFLSLLSSVRKIVGISCLDANDLAVNGGWVIDAGSAEPNQSTAAAGGFDVTFEINRQRTEPSTGLEGWQFQIHNGNTYDLWFTPQITCIQVD